MSTQPNNSFGSVPSSKKPVLDKWLLAVLGTSLTVLILAALLLLASFFYPVVALLSVCLILTYMLLFPVAIMEKIIRWFSQQCHKIDSFSALSSRTPNANPRILAVFLVYFIFLMVLTLGLLRYTPVLTKEIRGLGDTLGNYSEQLVADAIDWSDKTLGTKNTKRIFQAYLPPSSTLKERFEMQPISEREKKVIRESLIETTTGHTFDFILKSVNAAVLHVLDLATGTFLGVIYALSGFLLVFYFLLDGERMARYSVKLLPSVAQEGAQFFTSRIHQVMDAFIRGQVLLGICTGVYMFIVYSIFGVPYAFLLGVFMALCECLPVIGTWLGLAPAIVVMLFALGPVKTLVIWLFSYAYQTVKDNIIAPKIVGDTMGLHPFVVILSLLICAHFAGLLGVLLALPIASILKVTLQYVSDYEARKTAVHNGEK
ncbi:MAG: AI-2E family transporter [Vampirovibrionales bacterium]|nr:AI-2E family transporter [Vampirovibrionales bacterium]